MAAPSGTPAPFSRPPPVSAARLGTRGRAGAPALLHLGPCGPCPGLSGTQVPLPPRTAQPRRPLTHYRAPGAAASLVLRRARQRRDGFGRTAGSPPSLAAGGEAAGEATVEPRPARGRLPGLVPPPLPAERCVPAGDGCAVSAPRTAPARPRRPGPAPPAPTAPGAHPSAAGSCALHPRWPPPCRKRARGCPVFGDPHPHLPPSPAAGSAGPSLPSPRLFSRSFLAIRG